MKAVGIDWKKIATILVITIIATIIVYLITGNGPISGLFFFLVIYFELFFKRDKFFRR